MLGKNWFILSLISSLMLLNSPYPRNIRNFHDFVTKAQSWGEKTYRNWKISTAQKQAIFNYSATQSKDINYYLIKNCGKLLVEGTKQWRYWETVESLDVKNINTIISHLDDALLKANVPDALIVYKRAKETFFDIEIGDLRSYEDFSINLDIFQSIKNKFLNQKIIMHNYLSTSLINEPNHFTFNHKFYPILFEIIVPKWANAAYIGNISRFEDEVEMLINRNYALFYRHFKIIEINGIETLSIKASLE